MSDSDEVYVTVTTRVTEGGRILEPGSYHPMTARAAKHLQRSHPDAGITIELVSAHHDRSRGEAKRRAAEERDAKKGGD